MTHAALGGADATGASVGPVRTQRVVLFTEDDPLLLESGTALAPVEVAYETYGTLAADAGNAVVVCHALTGDANAAGYHDDPERPGWWDTMIGPGKPVDTERLFVVSSNLLGGCSGTTGPSSLDPATGAPYGLRFPLLGVGDLVTVQRRLLRRLGVERLFGAIGGSLGGMQVLQWALDHPDEIERAVVVAAAARLTAQNIAFSAVARAAITSDEHFNGGDYYAGPRPDVGLAIARQLAHITYVSEEALERKFGRARRTAGPVGLGVDFEVESYLDHQGARFLERFDANSYLYLSRVMDTFDPLPDGAEEPLEAVGDTRFLFVSFDSDWRFASRHSAELARLLGGAGYDAQHAEIASPWGHDSFLLPVPAYHDAIGGFLGTR